MQVAALSLKTWVLLALALCASTGCSSGLPQTHQKNFDRSIINVPLAPKPPEYMKV